MMSLHVTSLVAGLFALMMVPLSFQITIRRFKVRTVSGDAGDETLRRRIRAHGNFIEYAPTALIVLGLVEGQGAPSLLVWPLGIAFLLSRAVHAIGMLYASTPMFRAIGMTVQHAAFLISGAWLIFFSIK
jgi:uncharacterized membrane protein YecN with MAPEG domain